MDINSWKETWGTIDWGNDSEDIIKQKITDLYNAGVDFNMGGEYKKESGSPLDFAARFSTPDVIKLLIDGGADLGLTSRNYDHYTALHWAAQEGKVENVKCLIDCGPKNLMNKESRYRDVALGVAASYGQPKVLKALIEYGADVNRKNDDGTTVLFNAASSGNAEAVNVLIEAGADVNVQANDGDTPLHVAAHFGRAEAVKILIDHGAAVNVKNKHNKIPLHEAVFTGSAKAVIALIERGADAALLLREGSEVLEASYVWKVGPLLRGWKLIRGSYLKMHPKASLQKTLNAASEEGKKESLLKRGKNAITSIFKKER